MTDPHHQQNSRRTTSRFLLGMVIAAFVIVSLISVMNWYGGWLSVSARTMRPDLQVYTSNPRISTVDSTLAEQEKELLAVLQEMDHKEPLPGPDVYRGKNPLELKGGEWIDLSLEGQIKINSAIITSGKPDESNAQISNTYQLPYSLKDQPVHTQSELAKSFPYRSLVLSFECRDTQFGEFQNIQVKDLQTNWMMGTSLKKDTYIESQDQRIICDIPAPLNNSMELSFDLCYGEKQSLEISSDSPEIFTVQGVRMGMLAENRGLGMIYIGTRLVWCKSQESPLYFTEITAKTDKGIIGGYCQNDSGKQIECIIPDIFPREIESVHLSWYPYRDHLTYTIDRFPGVYTTGGPYRDFLDVPVEYIRFDDSSEMEDWLSEALQLRLFFQTRSNFFPVGTFPVTYEHTTTGEIFEKYRGLFPPKSVKFIINEEQAYMDIESEEKKGWLESVLEKLF